MYYWQGFGREKGTKLNINTNFNTYNFLKRTKMWKSMCLKIEDLWYNWLHFMDGETKTQEG